MLISNKNKIQAEGLPHKPNAEVTKNLFNNNNIIWMVDKQSSVEYS